MAARAGWTGMAVARLLGPRPLAQAWRSAELGRRGTSAGCSRFISSGGGKSKTRRLAEELAAKRRSAEDARIATGEGDQGGVSLAGLGVASSIVGLAGVSYLAFSDEGSKWFNQYVYEGTPIGRVYDWVQGHLGEQFKEYTNPVAEELLPEVTPEMLPPGMAPLRTLVVDFEDTLCHLEWDRRNGWRAVKRPGVDQFMRRLFNYYEIVLFTSGFQHFLEPFIMNLDPYGMIQHKLYREATLYENGEHVKDLSNLNRDLRRVVAVDDKPESLRRQPDNLVPVAPFSDPTKPDTALIDILPFLEDLVERDVPDVRQEITKYRGKDIATEFKAQAEERKKRAQEKESKSLRGAIMSGFMGGRAAAAKSSLGAAAPSVADELPLANIPMTPLSAADSLQALPPQNNAAPESGSGQKKVGSLFGGIGR